MTPAERLALIRERARPARVTLSTKPRGLFCATHPEATPTNRQKLKRQVGESRKKFRSDLFGLSLTPPTRRNGWVKEPDPMRLTHLNYRRQKTVNPLTRIAEQLPMKLQRIPPS